jgi:hypothetical protein
MAKKVNILVVGLSLEGPHKKVHHKLRTMSQQVPVSRLTSQQGYLAAGDGSSENFG